MTKSLNILLVSENISKQMGGEAGKIFVYLNKFQERGHSVWVVCHSRVKEELRKELSHRQFEKICFIDDTGIQRALWMTAKAFPLRVQELIFNQCIYLITQIESRKIAKRMTLEHQIDVVFQPTPNTPLAPSAIYDVGAPVVIGPLTGGMDFPPGFSFFDSTLTKMTLNSGRALAALLHKWMPGKLEADEIIVANKRTQDLLPETCKGRLHVDFLESGVDLEQWQQKKHSQDKDDSGRINFVYVGRLIDWKGVNYLIEAFQKVNTKANSVLNIVGDGEDRQVLQEKACALGIEDQVYFLGHMEQKELATFLPEQDVFVLPSLRESGGNALLEAMAVGLPVIVTNWGGPGFIVDSTSGIKVEPSSPNAFVDGLAQAMARLAHSQELRTEFGQAARKRVTAGKFDWNSKVEFLVNLFTDCSSRYRTRERDN